MQSKFEEEKIFIKKQHEHHLDEEVKRKQKEEESKMKNATKQGKLESEMK